MFYLLSIVLFMISSLYGDDFDRLNSSPTIEMIQNMKDAKVCKSPAIAKQNFSSDFRYGCFCGKNYPNIISKTKKSYQDLSRGERDELIAKYYLLKPYDSIDAVCMKHDICYIYEGREDQLCNDALFSALRDLSSQFYDVAREQDDNSTAERCERLSSDIGVVFKTAFALADNTSMMRFGMVMMINTPLTVMSKGIRTTSYGMKDKILYPLPNEKCELLP